MKTREYSQAYLRKRKAMLVMPLIIIPFIVCIAWFTGIVGPEGANAQSVRTVQGINTSLPAAIPAQDSAWNKLSFYEQADKDSARLRQLQRQDPYLNKHKRTDDLMKKYGATPLNTQPYNDPALHSADAQEKKVYERINAIQREINIKPVVKRKAVNERPVQASVSSSEVDRLERMMQLMNDQQKEEDPEMRQLATLMESIKDIQHPERVKDRMEKEEVKQNVYVVEIAPKQMVKTSVETNRFFSLDSEQGAVPPRQHTIEAVVHDRQAVGNNELVKLRLVQTVYINGTEIPENHFVFALAKIDGNRLKLHIPAMQIDGRHFPVSLDVIGHDGMEGVPISNSKLADAAGNMVDKSAQGLTLASLDPSLGAQVANAAIQSGKSLIKKQTKIVRYTIPAGYSVLLSAIQ